MSVSARDTPNLRH